MTKLHSTIAKFLTGTAGAALLPFGAAQAQDSGESVEDRRSDGEIVVTATRREESIQDIPLSVTAFGADDIRAQNMQSTADIANQAPNIQLVQGNFGFGAPIISIRGITNGDFSATSNTPVTVYSDGVVLTNIVSHGFGLYDLERIELLRGPQGTLFGRNSTSGALQFVSARPTDEFSAGGEITFARHNDLNVEGYVSGPIAGDVLKARVSGYHRRRSGVVNNVAQNGKNEFRINNWSVRGLLEFTPSDAVETVLKVQHSQAQGSGVIFHNSGGDNLVYTPFGPIEPGGQADRFRNIALDLLDRPEDVKSTEVSLNTNIYLNDDWTLTAVLGYLDVELDEFNDDDATTLRALHEYANRRSKQYSGELRLNGQIGPVDLVTGAFYMTEKTRSVGAFEITDDPFVGTAAQNAIAAQFLLPPVLPANARLVTTSEPRQTLDAFALFAHGKVEFSPSFGATVGLRWSRDKKRITVFDGNVSSFISNDPFFYGQSVNGNPAFTNFLDLGGIFAPAGTVAGRRTDTALTGEASLEWTPNDDVLVYGSYRRGFKGGSFDPSQTSVPLNVVPSVPKETIDAYEIGAKTAFSDRKVYLNGALFYYDYKNFQAFEYLQIGGFLTNLLFTIPKVEVYGLELEAQIKPSDRWTIDLGLGLNKSKIKTPPNAANFPPGTVLTVAQGNKLRNAPEINVNATVTYDLPIADGNWYLTPAVEFNYTDKYFSDFLNTRPGTVIAGSVTPFTPNGVVSQFGSIAGDYHNLNLRLTLSDADDRYNITAFVQNVTGETQVTGRFPANIPASGTDFATVNDGNKRVWGIQAGFKF